METKQKYNYYTKAEDMVILKCRSVGYSFGEIGEMINRNRGSVRSRYYRLREGSGSITYRLPNMPKLNYDKIDKCRKQKKADKDIYESLDLIKNYKSLGQSIIHTSIEDLKLTIKTLKRLVDSDVTNDRLCPILYKTFMNESAFFNNIYSMCIELPPKEAVRMCWESEGVDRNKYYLSYFDELETYINERTID